MKQVMLIFFVAVLFACKKEAALEPSVPPTVNLLPQGAASYDDSIMAAYNKYKTYILYRFSQADYAYNHINSKTDSAFHANPPYIGPVLKLVYDNVFGFFPESFLLRTVPYKILLARYIGAGAVRSATGFETTYASLTIGWADSTISKLSTPAEMKKFRINLVRAYLERAYRATSMNVPLEFQVTMPAGLTYNSISNNAQKNQAGVIEPFGTNLNVSSDFLGYAQAIMTRKKTDIENAYFRPAIDVRGNYKKKYEIVVAYFKTEFGIDPQELGDNF